jgi:HEAT repeat protein
MTFTKLQIARALGSNDTAAVTGALYEIALAGEAIAAEMGYADFVAKMLQSPQPEVVAGAVAALGAMGSIGAQYIGSIAPLLTHPAAAVRASACKALGSFSDAAGDFALKLSAIVADDPEAYVKAAAIPVLASTGMETKVIANALNSSSPVVAGAACEALGLLGELSEEDAKKKLKEPSTCLSALKALESMGSKAYVSCLEDVVTLGLASKDMAYRLPAVEIVGSLAEAAMLPNVLKHLQGAIIHSESAGVRAAGALAFASIGPMFKEFQSSMTSEGTDCHDFFADAAEDTQSLSLVQGTVARRPAASLRKPKCAALYAIGRIKSPEPITLGKVGDSLNDTDWEVRLSAVETISALGRKAQSLTPLVANLLSDVASPVRAKALLCVGTSKGDDYYESVVEALQDPIPAVREAAAMALSTLGTSASDSAPAVYKLFNDKASSVRATAIRCIASMGDVGCNYAPVIATMMSEDDLSVRIAAIEALGGMGSEGAAFAEDISEHLYLGAAAEKASAQMTLAKLGVKIQVATAPLTVEKSASAPNYAAILAAERAKMGL